MDAKHDRSAWIKGPASPCAVQSKHHNRPWRLVLLGAPGVGKGTQAELLSDRLGACHLSTGDVFRAAKSLRECERSPVMDAALASMRRGELVSDRTVLEIIRERANCIRCGGGFLLDGFPRTVAQGKALQKLLAQQQLALDAVVSYELPLEQVIARICGRRTCANCKAIYHLTGRPPKLAGVCDACGGPLAQREDDRPEAVRVRLLAYEESTAPLSNFYKRLGLLVPVTVGEFPEETYNSTVAALRNAAIVTVPIPR